MALGILIIVVASAFVLVWGGLTGYPFLKDYLHKPPALPLPSQVDSIGHLPAPSSTLDERRAWQLRIAGSLIVDLDDDYTLSSLPDKTPGLVKEWREKYGNANTSSDKLLGSVQVLLARIESQDDLLKFLDDDRRTRLTAWLDDYMNRRRKQ